MDILTSRLERVEARRVTAQEAGPPARWTGLGAAVLEAVLTSDRRDVRAVAEATAVNVVTV